VSVDSITIATYNARAEDYATLFDSGAKPGGSLLRFMDALPAGGRVLDLGCGPAMSARHMIDAGFDVDAVDASPEMVRVAKATNGVTARLATFDDLDALAAYDGVWANFSLLHAPRDRLPAHLDAIARALRPRGAFHIGMKTGTGNKRDQIDRLYTFVTKDELTGLLSDAGFAPKTVRTGSDVGLAGTKDEMITILSELRHA